jgi:phage tail-like protein
MSFERGMSLLVQPDQWAHCTHRGTAALAGGGVELAWRTDDLPDDCPPPSRRPGGLVFDRWCRAYRARPERHAVDATTGDSSAPPVPGPFVTPLGLALDRDQLLYIADAGAHAVWVIDLAARRPLRRVPVRPAPIDVVVHCNGVLVLAPGAPCLYRIEGRRGPLPGPALVRPCYPHRLEPIGLARGPLVLWRNPDGDCAIADPAGEVRHEIAGATAMEVTTGGEVVVVAREPGQPFARFAIEGARWTELEPVGAPGYDGGAVCESPRGRIAFTTRAGIGWTVGSVARHVSEGAVVTHRMDSGAYRTRWGRMFLDACIPRSALVAARFTTTDDDESAQPTFEGAPTGLYRRPTGRERPWAQIDSEDRFETYEAPVHADRGRYLWIELTLKGTARVTPRIRAVRVERPGHGLLDALPKSWSRDDADADFLQRFLGPADGLLYELDRKAALRAVLVDPTATPQEALAWLASFAGLTLDRRWPEAARRTLISEAYPLFARRGTKAALARMIEIYLGFPPQIVELWQLRGLGGTVLGTTPSGPPSPTIGASARATGALGRFTVGGTPLVPNPFATAAHRFTVLVRGTLTAEQRAVVCDLIRTHGPAHTVGVIKELGSGMRIGTLRVGLTSYVGPQPQWAQAQLGYVQLGGDGMVGKPLAGSRVGQDSIAGRVRVG